MTRIALVRGNLALAHTTAPGYPRWTILHIPTGIPVARFSYADEARRALRALCTLGDWAFTDPSAARQPPYAAAAVQACHMARRPRRPCVIDDGRHAQWMTCN